MELLENFEFLPTEFKRQITLMKELEERQTKLKDELNEMVRILILLPQSFLFHK